MPKLKRIIEKALAEVDGFADTRQHKNLLGNKHKYINAILEALKKEVFYGNIQA